MAQYMGQSVSPYDMPGYRQSIEMTYVDPISDPVSYYGTELKLSNAYAGDDAFNAEIDAINKGTITYGIDEAGMPVREVPKAAAVQSNDPGFFKSIIDMIGGGSTPAGQAPAQPKKSDYTPALIIGGVGVGALALIMAMR